MLDKFHVLESDSLCGPNIWFTMYSSLGAAFLPLLFTWI